MTETMDQLIEELNELYLGRKSQIIQLCECLRQFCKTLIIYGQRSTAKTSVVKTLCERSDSFYAYINCNELFNNKMVYENILNQLSDKSDCFDSNQIHCNSLFDFIDCLRNILINFNKNRDINSKNTSFSQCIIVLDSIDSNQQLVNSNNSELITGLTNLEELTQNVCPISCLFISCQSIEWFSRISCTHFTGVQINFSNYSIEELTQILSKDCPSGYELNFYQNYIHIIVKSLIQLTHNLREIRNICLTHFTKYLEPITTGQLAANESAKLYKRFQSVLIEIIDDIPLKVIRQKTHPKQWLDSTKYLLIACYLSSYTAVKNDKKLFVKYEGKRSQKKAKVMNEDKECVGPKASTFERILHIYRALIELNARNSDQHLKEPSKQVLSQFQELVSLKYIHKSVSQNKNNCLSSLTKYEISSSVSLDFIKQLSERLDLDIKAFIQ